MANFTEEDIPAFLEDIGMQPSLDVGSWQTPSGFDFGDISGIAGLDAAAIDPNLAISIDDILADPTSMRGYYDETDNSKYIYDPLGPLNAPLDDTSGTNLDSMKDYTYDQKTGTWTTPSGDTYTPGTAPSHQAKSGAQVMVDSGALPSGYAGLTPTKGSTADLTTSGGAGNTIKVGGNSAQTGAKSGMDPMMLMLLMYLMSQGSKGGSAAPQAVIPRLQANQSQVPYSKPSRPGAGGVTYFNPTTYTPMAAGGMATGGISTLGSYSDGGRLLKGPGDGVSDSIPATIGGTQKAALADGEFVVPARIVSELGNGSTDAGARKLYAMMDRIQKERRKTKNVAADTKADKHLPA